MVTGNDFLFKLAQLPD